MNDAREATATLLAEKPRFESALRDVLAVDDRETEWTFDDVPLDSGAFGELVSRNIVESEGDGYRIADSDGVRAALEGKATTPTTAADVADALPAPSLPGLDRATAVALAGALALVAAVRLVVVRSVFRGGDIVLPGNDPWAYRYGVDRLAESASGPLDLGVLVELPDVVSTGEPLVVAGLWWISALFDGSDAALASTPVAAAVVTAALTYLLAVRLTGDRRVGIAAVAILAVTPAHALRTALGFVDHHAFDYVWLTLTALALVALTDREYDLRSPRPWLWAGALGTGVAGQVLGWNNGPLLLVPAAVATALAAVSTVRVGRSPARAHAPLLAGLGLGAAGTILVHVGLGWHTTTVAATPVLLFVGAVGVVLMAEGGHRADVPARGVAGGTVGVGLLGAVVAWTVVPGLAEQFVDRLEFLVFTGGIAETTSLVGGQVGTLVGPVFLFGFALFLALPYLAWSAWLGYREHAPEWLVASVYGWYFLLLALVQARFAGELAPFAATFAGLGFVHLAAAVDVARPPTIFDGERQVVDSDRTRGRNRGPDSDRNRDVELPERRQAMSLAVLALGAGSLSLIQTPVKLSQVTASDAEYRAAAWMREYADDQGWTYPENYVLSKWDRSRLYNYLVNGESRSYAFASRHYDDFRLSTDPEEWYGRMSDRVGFVVTRDDEEAPSESLQSRLHDDLARGDERGLGHYRAVFAAEDGSLKAFTLVPGVRLTGPAQAGETDVVSTEVATGGIEFTYERSLSAGTAGVYDVVLAHPGEYVVGDESVSVSEADVTEGRVFSRFEGAATARWTFDEGSGDMAYDRAGGHHGTIRGANWTQGSEPALTFDGEGARVTVRQFELPQTFTANLWVNPDELDVSDENDYRDLLRGSGGSLLVLEQNGRVAFRIPGVTTDRLFGGRVPLDEWTHVAASYDGETQRLYVNGERVGRQSAGDGTVEFGDTVWIGSTPNGGHAFSGAVDDVRIDPRALSDGEIESRYEDGR